MTDEQMKYRKMLDKAVKKAVTKGDFSEMRELGVTAKVRNMPDDAMEIAAHKLCYNLMSMPPELRKKSKSWLLERGYSVSIFRCGTGG